MIGSNFRGILKKYENIRTENGIYVRMIIRHTNESPNQTFLKPFASKVIDNVEHLFTFPVRWKKLVIDTSDYINKAYEVNFGEAPTFIANLSEIGITRKLVDGSDIFEYSLHLEKELSTDTLDRLIAEAYLNYKEENEAGKEVLKEFDVKFEIAEKTQNDLEDPVF
jgi:hypothetical protein